jgi:hypothetical protein
MLYPPELRARAITGLRLDEGSKAGKTLIWYQCSCKAFDGATSSEEAINRRIVELREHRVSPTTIISCR